jgi:hypothetical protein
LRPIVIASAAVCVCIALTGCGSNKPPPPNPYTENYRTPRDENYHGGPNAMLLKYDANHDGSVTRAELQQGLRADFDRYDTRHTGCLTPDQVSQINAERIAADQSAATPLQDFRQNGCVAFDEFAAAPKSLFDELDKNGDGTVTPKEFTPGRGAAGGPGQRQGGGNNPPNSPPPAGGTP